MNNLTRILIYVVIGALLAAIAGRAIDHHYYSQYVIPNQDARYHHATR